jgi:hypothetical protein
VTIDYGGIVHVKIIACILAFYLHSFQVLFYLKQVLNLNTLGISLDHTIICHHDYALNVLLKVLNGFILFSLLLVFEEYLQFHVFIPPMPIAQLVTIPSVILSYLYT